MNHEHCACKQLKTIVYGQRPDQTDGVLSITMGHGKVLHGTPEEPGGLVKEVQDIKKTQAHHSRLIWMAHGFWIAVSIVWGIYVAFKK